MLKRNDHLNKGINKICDGQKDSVFMDVFLLKTETEKTEVFFSEELEVAFLLISGHVRFKVNNAVYEADRPNCFTYDPYCLHVCHDTTVEIESINDAEILIQTMTNANDFIPKWYDRDNIDIQVSSCSELIATTKRKVVTILDLQRAPYSKMVLGEVINLPGIWSSYPPHHHPQPEVYFYKFDKPQGFGTCFIGDDAYKVVDNSIAFIDGNKTHPQNAAPGYAMYYVWMIPHLKGNPWLKTRVYDTDHEWLNGENLDVFKLKEY